MLLGASAQALEGRVVRVTDGDTLWLRISEGRRPLRVRLQGIDAPELCQAGGLKARQVLEGLVLGRRVQVRGGPVDRYGRQLVQVRVGAQDVAEALVRQGWAWSDDFHGRLGPYADEEREARAQRRGLFAEAGAIPPRAFRQIHGACVGPPPAHLR